MLSLLQTFAIVSIVLFSAVAILGVTFLLFFLVFVLGRWSREREFLAKQAVREARKKARQSGPRYEYEKAREIIDRRYEDQEIDAQQYVDAITQLRRVTARSRRS